MGSTWISCPKMENWEINNRNKKNGFMAFNCLTNIGVYFAKSKLDSTIESWVFAFFAKSHWVIQLFLFIMLFSFPNTTSST